MMNSVEIGQKYLGGRSEEDTFDVHTKERVGGPSKHMHSGEVVCCEVAHKGEGETVDFAPTREWERGWSGTNVY